MAGSEEGPRAFAVACIHCRTIVLGRVPAIADEETHALRAHLRACRVRVGESESMGELLQHFRVRRAP